MDIAEIRKKAQRERERGMPTARPVPPPSPSVAEPLEAEDVSGYEEYLAPDEESTLPAIIPQQPVFDPASYDPLALILEGRRAALVGDDLLADVRADSARDAGRALEILCFRVADEMYGVDIMELKEIIKPRETTEVPHAPPYIAGVISLRGIIIPVFVLRERLGLLPLESGGKERIIVVKKGEGLCGILVDEVIQVVRIAASSVEHPPAVLDGIDREFVSGIGRHEGKIIILLTMDKVLDASLA